MTSSAVRRAARAAALLPAAGMLLYSPAAFATGAKGDNGTVKIHDAATGEELRRNEPHVCTFYLDAFGFDSAQKVSWDIKSWAPTGPKGGEAKSGTITLDGSGHGRTEDLKLSDGHYKLYWNFDGEHGRAKQKVFWVDCGSSASTPPGKPGKPTPSKPGKPGTPTQPGTPSEGPSEAPSASPSTPSDVSPTASSPAPAAPSASPSSSAAGGKGGSLADTGSNGPLFGTLGAVALAMVAAGAWLVRRRRTAS